MNALDLAATKIQFSANKIAANPSFLSEGNYVNITEQYKKECALNLTQLQSLSLPHSSHLSLKVLSPPSLRTAGFYCVYQNNVTCQNGYFNITLCVCVCVCMCIRPLRCCLILDIWIALLILSLPACASVCAAAEDPIRHEPESCAMAGVDCRRFSLPIGRESTAFTFAVDTRPIGRPNEACFDQSRRSGIYASACST